MEEFRQDIVMKQAAEQLDNVNLLSMIESRIMEIIQIEDECKRKLPKLYNQRLPRFMRRRAACHDPKRVPKRLRPPPGTDYGSKSRKGLLKYRRRLCFRKHKRLLRKHASNKFKDPFKCLLHKWFAKRFKMATDEPMEQVPLYNNTKNQRNLYRETRYGCAFLSFAHLMALKIIFDDTKQLEEGLLKLNTLTKEVAGFTFSARSLKTSRYEIGIHLYHPDSGQYLCLVLASLLEAQANEGSQDDKKPTLILWIPRQHYNEIYKLIETLILKQKESLGALRKVCPRDMVRVRLLGPEARNESIKLAIDKSSHEAAIEDVDWRLNYPGLGASIGRCFAEKEASYVYYRTQPLAVDIVFKNKAGRLLWHKLIKNRAHLVGGHRDVGRLLASDSFVVKPDCSSTSHQMID